MNETLKWRDFTERGEKLGWGERSLVLGGKE